MSYSDSFNPPKKQKVESSSDESSDDDSLADSPMDGLERYNQDFKEIIDNVFGERSMNGANHGEFKEQVLRLQPEIPDMVKYVHVVCNQYARAMRLNSGSKWEKTKQMKEFYNSGALPKLKKRSSRPSYKLDFEGDEEEEQFLASACLVQQGLQKFSGFAAVLDQVALSRESGAAESKQQKGMHVFSSMELLLKSLPRAALQYMQANREGFPPLPSSFETENLPDAPPERLRWLKHIINKEEIISLIAQHPRSDDILQKLRATSIDDSGYKLARECGLLFQNMYPSQVKRQEVEPGRSEYVYTSIHREKMIKVRDIIVSRFITNFA